MEIWSGIDVSKHTFVASWVPSTAALDDFQRLPCRQFPRTAEGVHRYGRWIQQHGEALTGVVMEATGRYALELWAWMVSQQPIPMALNSKQAWTSWRLRASIFTMRKHLTVSNGQELRSWTIIWCAFRPN